MCSEANKFSRSSLTEEFVLKKILTVATALLVRAFVQLPAVFRCVALPSTRVAPGSS